MPGEVISLMAQGVPQASRIDEPVLRDASPGDASRFSDMMADQPPSAVQAPEGVQAVRPVEKSAEASSVAPVRSSAPGAAMGDAIIRSMQSAGRQYAEQTAHINSLFQNGGPSLSTVDLLRMQWEIANSTLLVDLFGKAVQKSTQHIDSLTKLQ